MSNVKLDPYADVCGTSFHGVCVYASVDEIEKAIGEPHDGPSDDDKCQAGWSFSVDGNACTLYDWKEYVSYDELRKRKVVEWHVGGTNKMDEITTAEFIVEKIDGHPQRIAAVI